MIGIPFPSVETHLIIEGIVQGVLFRKATKKHADRLGLKGYVRNLSNGKVEICVIGQVRSLLIEALKNEPFPISITKISIETIPLKTSYDHFEIRNTI